MKKILILTLAICLIPAFSYATDVEEAGVVKTISNINGDWSDSQQKVIAVILTPGATNDEIALRNDDPASGPRMPKIKSTDGEAKYLCLHGAFLKLCIDYSESTLSSGAYLTIIYGK